MTAGAPNDLDLMRGIAAGSEEAFRAFYRRWAPRLGPFLIRAAGSTEAGEDLLQEAFVRILRAAPRYEPRGSIGSWVYRICANLAYSHWRRVRSSPVLPARPGDEGGPSEHAGAVARPHDGPEGRRLRHAFRDELSSALERLSANQRMVFLLKADRGLSYQEIAAVLECPEGTARSRFHYAVLRLREELRGWSDGLGDAQAIDAAALLRRPSRRGEPHHEL